MKTTIISLVLCLFTVMCNAQVKEYYKKDTVINVNNTEYKIERWGRYLVKVSEKSKDKTLYLLCRIGNLSHLPILHFIVSKTLLQQIRMPFKVINHFGWEIRQTLKQGFSCHFAWLFNSHDF